MKILLATDGSDHARIAEVLLTRIPPYRNAEITVATCVAPPALIVGAMQPSGALAFAEEAIEVWEELRKTARATSDAVADRLKSAGLNATAVVLEGDAAAELVEQANENGYDLIAVAGQCRPASGEPLQGFGFGGSPRPQRNAGGHLGATANQRTS